MTPVEYVFTVDSLRPATASMQRVAEYFLELSKLLGQPEQVHFHKVTEGSLKCHALADFDATPKIDERIKQIALPDSDIARVYDRINQMLARDNAVGRLDRIGIDGKTAKIYSFPGRELPKVSTYKIRQQGSLDGVVVSIGGRDNSSHLHLDAGDGRYWKCVTSRELAVSLAHHLYGSSIRVFGSGTWLRDSDRKWSLDGYFSVEHFEVLTEETLDTALSRIRECGTRWDKQSISEAWKELREGDS
jgi:hypothetical protein